MSLRFGGRVVAVSGAGLGFGRAIATAFAEAGAAVFGCDIRRDGPEPPTGYDFEIIDLTQRSRAAEWIRQVEQRAGGPIDVLVNNAGGVAGQSGRNLEDVADAEWDVVLDINLGAAFTLSRSAVSGMKRHGSGCIINIASGAGLRASLTGIQAYCAAKHALVGFTRQLAHELGPFGIRTNAVAPGFVVTNEATRRQWDSYGPEGQRRLLDGIALRRLGQPEEIANAVLFLASDLSSFINGEVLSVDGGR